MLGTVTTAKKSAKKKPTFAEVGKAAAAAAQRALLLSELEAQNWNLTATGRELEMGEAPNVLRAIKKLGLNDLYKAARIAKIKSS